MRKSLNQSCLIILVINNTVAQVKEHINSISTDNYFWLHILLLQDKIVISQNELLTDDDELKRLPYRSGKEKGIYVKSKLHQMPVFTQPSIFYNCHSRGQNLSHCICHSVESCVWKKAYRQHTRTITYPLKSLLCSILYIKNLCF